MNHVLTLIADRTATNLDAALIGRVRDAVRGGLPEILAPGEAADIPVAAMPNMDVVRAAIGKHRVDAMAVKTRGRRKSRRASTGCSAATSRSANS